MTQPLLEVKNLKKEYAEKGAVFTILENINFQVYLNEMVVIMGTSGAGKTTLLNIIAGLEPPTDGTIILNGKQIHEMPDKVAASMRRTQIGLIFQEFYLLPYLTAHENVEIPLIFGGVPDESRNSRVRQAFQHVGMVEKEDFYPSELSGGEQQRVAIARAIVTQPVLLLIDEPTGNLDSKTGKKIISLFHKIIHNQKSSIIMVTHDPEAARTADRIFLLQHGCLEVFNP